MGLGGRGWVPHFWLGLRKSQLQQDTGSSTLLQVWCLGPQGKQVGLEELHCGTRSLLGLRLESGGRERAWEKLAWSEVRLVWSALPPPRAPSAPGPLVHQELEAPGLQVPSIPWSLFLEVEVSGS